MSIGGEKNQKKTNKKTHSVFSTKHRLPAVSSCQGLLSLYHSCEKAACDLYFCPISLKDDFHILQRGRTVTDEVHAANGSAVQGSGGGRCLSVLFSIFTVPCGKALVLFLCWSWTLTFIPFLFWLPLLFFPAVTRGGLGEQCCRIIELWRECKFQAAPRPVCFLIGKRHFAELNWHRGSAKTRRVQEYSLFPGPGSAEVGLSEEEALGEGGEERGTRRSRCSWLGKESCSNQGSAVSQTIHSFGERQTKHSLSVQRINVRGWS